MSTIGRRERLRAGVGEVGGKDQELCVFIRATLKSADKQLIRNAESEPLCPCPQPAGILILRRSPGELSAHQVLRSSVI